jgi:hypothetical protein
VPVLGRLQTKQERAEAYRRIFEGQIDAHLMKNIRESFNK